MSVFFMAYAIGFVSENGQATIEQRTPDGWIFLTTRFRPVAARWVNSMNEQLRQTYADNGYIVEYRKEPE
jgi:hypothetical protein